MRVLVRQGQLWHSHRRRRAFSAFGGVEIRRGIASTSPSSPEVWFFGSDTFSGDVLRALHAAQDLWSRMQIVAPPPVRFGRGRKQLYEPPILSVAEELDIPVHVLQRVEGGLTFGTLPIPNATPQNTSLLISASFPAFIPASVLDRFGPARALNVHPSLLPEYWGAAPIQWQIVRQEVDVGVTVQELSRKGFDRGRILGQEAVALPASVMYEEAERLLAASGGSLLVETLRFVKAAKEVAGPESTARRGFHARKVSRDHTRVPWKAWTAQVCLSRQRGFSKHYPLWALRDDTPVYFEVEEAQRDIPTRLLDAPAGTAILDPKSNHLIARCADNAEASPTFLGITRLKDATPTGKGWVNARNWWNGKISHQKDAKLLTFS